MSKIVWTPEDGWTDDGPEATIDLDERGRIRIRPGRPCKGIGPDHAHASDCWGTDETGTRHTDWCYACWLAYWTE